MNESEIPSSTHERKRSFFWVGTLTGGVAVAAVGYACLQLHGGGKHPSSKNINTVSAWWNQWFLRSSQLPVAPEEAAAAAVLAQQQQTTTLLHTTVQQALHQFQQELQNQLLKDRNSSTVEWMQSMQKQERWMAQSVCQPIHSTQQQMEAIQKQLRHIHQMFVTPNTRGMMGELQLELLIQDVIPSSMYSFQYTLSNKKRVDCMLHLPPPIGNISIDSKFPTFNTANEEEALASQSNSADSLDSPNTSSSNAVPSQQRKKEIRDKLQKHITDIATKYIIPGETSQHAICFIPSVTLFLDIINHHTDILFLAHKQNVWITCPTTLLAVLTTIQGLARGQVVAQRTNAIFASMQKLSKDIDLLVNRFEAAEKSIDKTKNELSKMQISVQKIQKVKMELDLLSTQTADVSVASPALLEEVPTASLTPDQGISLNGAHLSTLPQELQTLVK